ncbi:MAG TPA: hypothetical protein VEL74_17670 [Thermoanaerobaculia bacterium]|nr:hypothetical protein [Thermoanaerobaculia bacterium]
MQTERTIQPRAAANIRSGGFSVIEVLIASAIFLVIAVGLLPLFAQSITSNLAGRETTDTTNHGRSRLEEIDQLSFFNPNLTVPAGETEGTVQEYWSQKDKIWKAGAPPLADPALWMRTTRVRQFSVSDLNDDGTFDSPLDGDAAPGQVHLKEIQVAVRSAREGTQLADGTWSTRSGLGGIWESRMRTLKAK